MTAGIITNRDKDPASSYTAQICDFLMKQGVCISQNGSTSDENFLTDADFWVVLGGDGTMLHWSHIAAIHDIPLLGINLGTLGFLTDADKQDGLEALAKILAGEYETENRLMLEISSGLLALNDVYVDAISGLKTFDLYVNDSFLDTIRADGIIVATPTGSTAYNLSAGGPLLMPGSQMMVITPVCPHSLSTRPLVINAEDVVTIVTHQPSSVSIDGEMVSETRPKERVIIRKSAYNAKIIKTSQSHLYDVLRKKKLI
ncbi:MAG: NAD(+)/NADH kinase [Firmicutes bacterium]|nr:NAD(+)/NADH kinase [Bacillota bacterium]